MITSKAMLQTYFKFTDKEFMRSNIQKERKEKGTKSCALLFSICVILYKL